MKRPFTGLLLLLPAALLSVLLFTACGNLADGTKMTTEYVIASGDTRLMQEKLAQLTREFAADRISDYSRGVIALDMIDLLAVLSGAGTGLAEYLFGYLDPEELESLENFLESAAGGYLEKTYEQSLLSYGIYADPSVLHFFWSILGAAFFYYTTTGTALTAGDIPDTQYNEIAQWLDLASEKTAGSSNENAAALLERLDTLVRQLDPTP